MKRGLSGDSVVVTENPITKGGQSTMLHAGLDLSRHRLDVHVMSDDGATLKVTTAPPDRDGLRSLVRQLERECGTETVLAVIESMTGARFVHDTLELCGWSVEVADGRKVKGLAPLGKNRIHASLMNFGHLPLQFRRSGHRVANGGGDLGD
jgi:hypothetical protein